MSIADRKRTNAPDNASVTRDTKMRRQSQTYQWYRILRKVTEEMGWVWHSPSKETLTKWSDDLRAIAKEMQLEARKAPL